ncbi:MAG: extracellular solute-binding protein, partial [Chloroflexi bacterium]|nr:extracellular solute-binding protein [Chloroflexota bacterium]NOH10600.1 extracellular solute-binding protein [Chloroflexota bacterium]
MRKLLKRSGLVLVLVIGACSALPETGDIDQVPEEEGIPTVTFPTPTPEAEEGAPTSLQIWLPEELNPADGSAAADLLITRLAEFEQRHPGLRINVRIKSIDGPGSLMAALESANEAAPLALPDIVAMPHTELAASVDSDLLYPLDDLLVAADDTDWYGYAQQMGQVSSATYGLPLSGDALILAYRQNIIEQAPADWETALTVEGPLVFPAADPQALFPLTLYQSLGGNLLDENGEATITPEVLQTVLGFFETSQRANLMPFWLTQFDNNPSAWNEFTENRANLAVTWWTQFLATEDDEHAAAPLPTQSGEPYTYVRGWVWALTSPDEEQRILSVELMEFLTEAEFMAGWTAAAGVLPP